MGYLDMHIHSTLSDGSLQPEQVLLEAVKNGVSLVSITDHDIIPSRDHWKYLSFKNKKIKLVPGIEISTDYYLDGQKVRIHLLSYDAVDKNGELAKELDRMKQARIEGNVEYVERLLKKCSFIDPYVFSNFNFEEYGWIKKLIIRHLENCSYTPSQQLELERFFDEEKAHYNGCTMKIESGIGLVKQAGGLTSFAHPYQTKLSHDDLAKVVKDLQEIGLDAVESFHSKASVEDNEFAIFLARKYNLLESAGSDLHSPTGKNAIGLGVDGNMKIESASLADRIVEEGRYFSEGKYFGGE